MKSIRNAKSLKSFVCAFVFLLVVAIVLSVYVIESMGINTITKVLLIAAYALFLSICTASAITRQISTALSKCMKELDEISAFMVEASRKMRLSANELEQDAVLLEKRLEFVKHHEAELSGHAPKSQTGLIDCPDTSKDL